MNPELAGHPHAKEMEPTLELIQAGDELSRGVEGVVVTYLDEEAAAHPHEGYLEMDDGRATGTLDLRDPNDPTTTYNLSCTWPGHDQSPVSIHVTANSPAATTEYSYLVRSRFRPAFEDMPTVWTMDADGTPHTIEGYIKTTPKVGGAYRIADQRIEPLNAAGVEDILAAITSPHLRPYYS